MPAVVVTSGPEAGRRVELDLEVAIGRQDTDLVVEDPEVSRRHAVLRRSDGSVVVEDLDSTNGTFVNGERIHSPIAVGPGDQIRVGQTTLEIESDRRADDTIVSRPPRQDQIRSAQTPSDVVPAKRHEDATQPLPSRRPQSASRPARSNRGWLVVGSVAAVVLAGVIAYATLVDRPVENDFAARANEACAAVERPEADVDLGHAPTRGELERAGSIRLQALGAMRTLGPPDEDAVAVSRFLAAFEETNGSIAGLERAIGADHHAVARAQRRLRDDVRDERELAASADIAGCGGLAIR